MINPENFRYRLNPKERFAQWRVRRQIDKLDKGIIEEMKLARKWPVLMEEKFPGPKDSEGTARFSKDGYYYSLVYSPELRVVVLETNKNARNGERSAVVYKDGQVHFLEALVPNDPENRTDPHAWRKVESQSRRWRLLANGYSSFKNAPPHNPNEQDEWGGREPNVQELLPALQKPKI